MSDPRIPNNVLSKISRSTQEELNNVEVRELGEPMVRIDLPEALGETMVFNYKGAWLRREVAEMLGGAAVRLDELRPDLVFCVISAYRSLSEQIEIFNDAKSQIALLNPDAGEDELYNLTTDLVADPKGALHTGGGAVDITIVDKDGKELDFGFCVEGVNGPCIGGDFADARNSLRSTRVPYEVFRNRLFIAEIMTSVGFYCDYNEWWHFDYKNRAWAVFTGNVCPYGDFDNIESFPSVVQYSGPKVLKNSLPKNLLLGSGH